MGDNDLELLNDYSKKLGLQLGDFTVKSLIESHQSLRQHHQDWHEWWLSELRAARERGLKEGRERALEFEYIEREKLKAMTLKEIADLLYEEED